MVIIQKNYRAFLLRRRFLHLKKAAIVFQKQLRGQTARRVYRRMLAEKRKEEEKRKREEEEKRRREEEERYSTPASLSGVKRRDTFGVLCSISILAARTPSGWRQTYRWKHELPMAQI